MSLNKNRPTILRRRVGIDLTSLSGERATRGIGIYSFNLARELVKLLHDGRANRIDFYFFSFSERALLEALLGGLPANVKTVQIPGGGKSRWQTLLGHQSSLSWLAWHYDLDVLHSLGYGIDPSQPGLPWLIPPTRRITTMHDLIPLHYPEIFLKQPRKRFWYKLMLGRAAHSALLLTNSEHTRQAVIAALGVDPATVICTPFAAEQVKNRAYLATDLPAGVPDQPFILAVGGPQPHKNLARLIQAFVNWQTQTNQADCVYLVITGAGPSRAELTALIPPEFKAQVRWLDNLTAGEMTALYRQARFLAFLSLSEGFGLPVLEAMTLNCPVLSSQAGALPEIGGEAAFYVNPLDIAEIENGLACLWTDVELRQKLKEAGQQQAQKFAWRRTAEQTFQAYLRLLQNL